MKIVFVSNNISKVIVLANFRLILSTLLPKLNEITFLLVPIYTQEDLIKTS